MTLTSTCQVIIGVQNVNDNPPHFLPPRVLVGSLVTDDKGTIIRIPENMHKGTVFMQLRTTDPDGDEDAKIRLEACHPRMNEASVIQSKPSKPIKSIFEVESESGKCWTTGILDRETIPAYLCSVVAEDGEVASGLSFT